MSLNHWPQTGWENKQYFLASSHTAMAPSKCILINKVRLSKPERCFPSQQGKTCILCDKGKRNKLWLKVAMNPQDYTVCSVCCTDDRLKVSFTQQDVFISHRSLVLQHEEDSGHPGLGWRIYTDHISSQVKGEWNIQCCEWKMPSPKIQHQTFVVCPTENHSVCPFQLHRQIQPLQPHVSTLHTQVKTDKAVLFSLDVNTHVYSAE